MANLDRDGDLIHNRNYLTQPISFNGFHLGGNKSLTDIDGYLDLGGKQFVFVEAKFNGAELPDGQRLALERLADATERGGVETLLLVASHNTEVGDIDLSKAKVTRMRQGGQWQEVTEPLTVAQAIDDFRTDDFDELLGDILYG